MSQKEPRIEQFVRGEDGEWRLREAAGLGARLELPSVKITIALSEVFANVKFEASRLRVAAPGKK